ncbi:MAG: recombinase [Candidatus Neomarinimicrobiota bacterium]|nr:hypothetical protein [Dysgonamonadaceae bacterium]
MTYEEYEQKCDEIRMRNAAYLDEFREDLFNAGLKEKTIDRHCNNADFYINTYLLREEPLEMTCGSASFKIDDFLGYFFIRKCMWSTPGAIKSTAASIKKFYSSMLQRGNIDKSNYRELIETIRDNMDCWLKDCESYNNPDAPNPFAFF